MIKSCKGMESKRSKHSVVHTTSNNISSNATSHTEDEQTHETPREFLNNCGGNILLRDAMLAVLQTRPKDPLAFLAEHFGSLSQPKDGFQNAYDKICGCHYSSDIFENILVEAYSGFREKRGNKHVNGLLGVRHNELLIALLKNTPIKLSEPILKRLFKTEKQSISFNVFRKNIFTVSMFIDFLETAKSMYDDVDFTGTGKADRELCNLFLNELKIAVNNKDYSGFKTSNIEKHLSLLDNENKTSVSKTVIGKDEFLEVAVGIFSDQI